MLAVLTILVVLGSLVTAVKYFKEAINGFRTSPITYIAYDNPQPARDEDEINVDEVHDRVPLQDNIPIDARGGMYL